MKNINAKFLLTITLVSLGSMASCDGDEFSPAEQMKRLLIGNGSKTWKIQSVTIDDTDQTIQFTGMTMKFSDDAYFTTDGGLVWPSSDTWEFTDLQAIAFYRSDGIEVQIETSGDRLLLSLDWTKTTYGGGRTASIAGEHIFEFGL